MIKNKINVGDEISYFLGGVFHKGKIVSLPPINKTLVLVETTENRIIAINKNDICE